LGNEWALPISYRKGGGRIKEWREKVPGSGCRVPSGKFQDRVPSIEKKEESGSKEKEVSMFSTSLELQFFLRHPDLAFYRRRIFMKEARCQKLVVRN
jgi:hypothetical protein